MCPFAQKAWIALEASRTPYKLEEISLYGSGGKPKWFWDLNPKGTVPVLECKDGTVLPDSDLILDHLNQNDNELNPGDSDLVQEWRSELSGMLPIGKAAILGSSKMDGQLADILQRWDDKVAGKYLAGDVVTVADCALFPFLWRIDDSHLSLRPYPKLSAWLQQCQNQQAFAKSIQSSWWWWW